MCQTFEKLRMFLDWFEYKWVILSSVSIYLFMNSFQEEECLKNNVKYILIQRKPQLRSN